MVASAYGHATTCQIRCTNMSFRFLPNCGKRCEIDVQDWVATQLDQRPDESIEGLAREAGVDVVQARRLLWNSLRPAGTFAGIPCPEIG
jgi:hypothetical protein